MTHHDGPNHDGSNHVGYDPAAGAHDAGAALHAAFAGIRIPAQARARHLHTVRHQAATLPVARPRASGRWQRLRLRVAAATATAALALAGGAGAAIAAEQALPGDALYSAKLALEQASLRLPTDLATRAQRTLALAERRLAEVEQLTDPTSALVAASLARHQKRLAEAGALAAGDPDLEATVEAAAAQAVQRLTELLDGDLPEQAADRAREALERARDRIEQRDDRGSTPPRGQNATPRDSVRPPRDRGPDARPDEPGRSGGAQQRSEDRGRVDRPDTDARPGGGFPPPSPGARAPRGPRS